MIWSWAMRTILNFICDRYTNLLNKTTVTGLWIKISLDFWETRNSPERRVWDKYECCRGRSQFIFGTNSLLAKFFPAVIA
mgnify:CR=1 FL=1